MMQLDEQEPEQPQLQPPVLEQHSDRYMYCRPKERVTTLSDTKQVILCIAPILPSFLSIGCSIAIIYMVRLSGTSSVYKRILLMFSICDIIASLNLMIGPFLLDQATSLRHYAFGTKATCTISGAVVQFGFSSFMYYGVLSFYFLLTVKFGMKDHDKMSAYFEMTSHIVAIGFPLITSIIGIILNVYSELDLGRGCWVNTPCNEDHVCIQNPPIIAWTYGALSTTVVLIAIIINNILVFYHVRTTIYKGIHNQQQRCAIAQQATITAGSGGGPAGPAGTTVDPTYPTGAAGPAITAATTAGSAHADAAHTAAAAAAATQTAVASTRTSTMMTTVPSSISSRSIIAMPSERQQIERVRQVGVQAFLYVSSFVVTYFIAILMRLFDAFGYSAIDENNPIMYTFMLYNAIMMPFIGFFNFLLYIRPTYLRVRRQDNNNDKTRYYAFQKALFGITNISNNSNPNNTATRSCPKQQLSKRTTDVTSPNDSNGTNNNSNNNKKGRILPKSSTSSTRKQQSSDYHHNEEYSHGHDEDPSTMFLEPTSISTGNGGGGSNAATRTRRRTAQDKDGYDYDYNDLHCLSTTRMDDDDDDDGGDDSVYSM